MERSCQREPEKIYRQPMEANPAETIVSVVLDLQLHEGLKPFVWTVGSHSGQILTRPPAVPVKPKATAGTPMIARRSQRVGPSWTSEEESATGLLPSPRHKAGEDGARATRAGDVSDGFALFRRAIGGNDEWAWTTVYRLYYGLVLTWVRQQDSRAQLSADDQAALTNAAFAKFARVITTSKLENLPTLPRLLSYLKRCAKSCTIDELRQLHTCMRHEAAQESDIEREPTTDDPAEVAIARVMGQELWHIVQAALCSPDERLVVACLFLHHLSPREALGAYPERFASVEEIYRRERKKIGWLRRNHRLLSLVERDGPRSLHKEAHSGKEASARSPAIVGVRMM